MKNNIEFQVAEHDFTLVIYGASGSLAKLKLFPAIYELALEKRLPKDYRIVGYSRTPLSQEDFQKHFEEAVRQGEGEVDEKVMKSLLKRVHYFSGQYNSASDHKKFLKYLRSIEQNNSRVRIAYFSVPPSAFTDIFDSLAEVNFNTRKAPLRLVIEKPFGYNLRSAKTLRKVLSHSVNRDQVFLLDHYLGKEAVSNLLSLRYANPILSNLLSPEYVSNIQISALEDRDIEGRANYFDNVGILRDMVQSHLLQILAYLMMEAPKEETAEAIHAEKAKLLESLRIHPNEVVRGQYQGYTKTKGVPDESMTETYAALKINLKSSKWKKVPIYLRTGKALKTKWTAIVVEFKPKHGPKDLPTNRLVIQLQPHEKIEFHMLTKLGGRTFDFHELATGRPIYCSGDCLSEHGRLFLDVVAGKQDLFLNFEEIFASWKVIDPLQKYCDRSKRKKCTPAVYATGGMGPKEADALIKEGGFKWHNDFPQ